MPSVNPVESLAEWCNNIDRKMLRILERIEMLERENVWRDKELTRRIGKLESDSGRGTGGSL